MTVAQVGTEFSLGGGISTANWTLCFDTTMLKTETTTPTLCRQQHNESAVCLTWDGKIVVSACELYHDWTLSRYNTGVMWECWISEGSVLNTAAFDTFLRYTNSNEYVIEVDV